MLDAFLGVFVIVEIFITLSVTFYIAGKAQIEYRDRNNFILSALGDFIKGLFVGKNWFGIITGLVVFIILIPAILLMLLGEAITWLVVLLIMTWSLRNKRNNVGGYKE